MTKNNHPSGALAQAFYLSEQFQALDIETRDYRDHPVLGGISSTRWKAYDIFSSENSKLADNLGRTPKTANAIQLKSKKDTESLDKSFLKKIGIQSITSKNYSLRTSGFLSGNKSRNKLTGSPGADLLMGWSGRDILIGSQGDDLLSGGAGADRFRYKETIASAGPERDEIVDFNGEEGDRLAFSERGYSLVNEFSQKKGEVTFAVWIAKFTPSHGETIYPWMYGGTLIQADRNGDKIADLLIDLPGVLAFQKDWIIFD